MAKKYLPEKDRFLIEKIKITFHELVNGDYREIWDKFPKSNLSPVEVKRLKHIRKREKNKKFEKDKDLKGKETMEKLQNEKENLIYERNRLREEIKMMEREIQSTN